VVAVVATLSKGYDLDYVWRQVGATAGRNAVSYYLQATESGGEPPGRWWGPGAEALGFAVGQVVEREPYDLLFGQRKAPDGTLLARPPSGGRAVADLYVQLLAAEPHATAERRRELRVEAAARARQSPLYFDLTISLSKSISVFHASLGENARLARQVGDRAGEGYWAGRVGEVEQMIWQAVCAGFAYFQREVGYTRTGSHATRVDGRETGQWREADLAVAHWLQHTSRDGDMQLHVHSQIAHAARTVADGKWRAPDSYGYNEHVGAVAAVVSQHLEEALTRRFGVEWVARDDGHGFEIAGVSGAVMRLFSTRRESITADTRERARRFAARYGRAPSQRELAHLAQASNFATRARKNDATLDFDALHAAWARRLSRALGVQLASVAPSAWHQMDAGGATRERRELSKAEVRRAGLKAVALAQREKATWTRADVIKCLGRVLPRTGMDPDAAAGLLEQVAGRALAGEFEPVACLEAPEAVEPPRDLVRADGRSVYQRHGGVRYATRAQLSIEERMVTQARGEGAPALTREQAARALGASVTQLDATLTQPCHGTPGELTRTGLRADQAAAAYAALTDGRRVLVIDAAAGSGKTTVLAATARAWTATMPGRVIGIAPAQSARNTLAAAGVQESYNTAQFLGHLRGRRGALGPVKLRPGDLMLADEASMWSTADLSEVTGHAAASGAKVILVGDSGQLQAVETGGGMTLLEDQLGFVRLAEPVRFAEAWERTASLRLRAGDGSVLAEYDQHGRIIGGSAEEMMDAAARAYVAHTLDGTDVLLMAADHARRRELCRRIRDDLIHLGRVSAGPSAVIADGIRASAGDLIVCTQNEHLVEAGETGRTLANGDLLRIDEVIPQGLVVRRALDADPVTGRRRWTERRFLYRNYGECELGYAVTDHVAQSRTVHAGLALIAGTEDRQHAYVALSRAIRANTAYVIIESPATADPAPGARPAPELARHDRVNAQRNGEPAPSQDSSEVREQALAVLAQVIGRDGQELSATATRARSLANADHLAVLHAIWAGEVTPVREQQYRDLLAVALPPQYQGETSHRTRWLWRTLWAAELAGLHPGQVLAEAIGQRSLSDARDIAAVIDSRIRQRTRGLVPLPPRPWSEQVPGITDPERLRYVTELAAAMDVRTERIGQLAARHAFPWAVRGLGPVPGDPVDRLAWQQRASVIGAYRELHGWDHPTDPIGPESAGDAPDKRAAWHAALAALGPADGLDVRGLPDGLLLHLRDTYPIETAWAPQWVGDQLRQVRRGADDARLSGIRAQAEATAARRNGDTDQAARHNALAASYQAMERAYRDREIVFAAVMDDRAAWEQVTTQQRRRAVAADAELRRRHPGIGLDPLRSAEPEPITDSQASELTLTPGQPILPMSEWITQLSATRSAFAQRIAENHGVHRDPSADLGPRTLGGASPAWGEAETSALLQPPKPQIPPARRVLERAVEMEAAH